MKQNILLEACLELIKSYDELLILSMRTSSILVQKSISVDEYCLLQIFSTLFLKIFCFLTSILIQYYTMELKYSRIP